MAPAMFNFEGEPTVGRTRKLVPGRTIIWMSGSQELGSDCGIYERRTMQRHSRCDTANRIRSALFNAGGALKRLIGCPTTPFDTTIAAFVRRQSSSGETSPHA